MSTTTTLMIQWLTDPDDGNEVTEAANKYCGKFEIAISNLEPSRDKYSVRDAILSWALDNNDAQLIYIGSHGFDDRIGPSSTFPSDEEGIRFSELWGWIQEAHELIRQAMFRDKIARCELIDGVQLDDDEGRIDIWFGACNSANVVSHWHLTEAAKPWPVCAVASFADKPKQKSVARFLDILLSQQQIHSIQWPEDTWRMLLHELDQNQPVVFGLNETDNDPRWSKAHGY